MGKGSSKPGISKPVEAKIIPGILPIGDLSINYNIENLVFADSPCLGFSYLGSVTVLEKLGILKGIKRFAGVGIGAILAALLAVSFDSNEIQYVLDQNIDDLMIDDNRNGPENVFDNISQTFEWNSGTKFRDCLSKLLYSKSDETDLTFSQLHEKTGKELCVVATNIDTLTNEYFHPKTTPDMPITHAILMSISIPVLFAPIKCGPRIEKYHLVHGSLLCSYPIHCFDGWLLSMDSEDSILNRLDDPHDYLFHPKVFNIRNQHTLGFYPIERHRENDYNKLRGRLTNVSAGNNIPNTRLGRKYKTILEQQICSRERFILLRKTSNKLISMVESAEDEFQYISEDLLAEIILAGYPLSQEDRTLSFPEFGQDAETCANFLKALTSRESKLTRNDFTKYVERKILAALNEYSSYERADINNAQTYFGKLFNAKRQSSFDLSKADFDRTVGILCGYVGCSDNTFEEDDQKFLYIQGWNATVDFFQNSYICDEPVHQSS